MAGVAVALAVALAACSGGDDDGALPASTSTAPPSTSPSTVPPTTSTTVVATTTTAGGAATTAPVSSPEGRARALYAAWASGDRGAAEAVAQREAVVTLFARPWQASDGWTFAECAGAAGSVICTWQRPSGQQVLFRVQNVAPVTVSEVRFLP